MKKVLFIGHSYHRKTKSADFFLDIIKTKYDFETFYFDPYKDDYIKFNDLNGLEFDIIILWQISPDIEKLTSYVKAKQIVFFPMYDGVAGKSFNFWYSYRNVKIINFSKTLHEKLKKWGLDTHYIQYFPKPADKQIFGNEKQIYFWQRIQKINIKIVEQLFSKIGFDGIHLHKALDPTYEFIEPSNRIKDKIEYSTWYDKKEDMLKDIQKAGIYIAPRHLEGIGMSFLEAMAMGKCVVAPNLPTMNEYIKHNETGILYDLKNPKPLNEFDGKSLGEKSYNYIKQGYAIWEKEKFNMLDWMEEPVLIDNKKLKKQNLKIIRYKLFNFLPILTIKSRINKIKILLFGCVPFIIIKKNEFRFFYICLFKKVDRKKDFLLTFLWKYIASLNCKRNMVLILDNLHESEANISDNFCFFEYLCKQKSTSLSPYYLISKESPYCCYLKEKYGKRVLVYDKKRALFFKFYFTFLLFRLKYICESFRCLQIVNSNLYRIIKKSKYIFSIFTQHGITYFKPDFITPDSYGFNKFDCVIVSNEKEKELFQSRGNFPKDRIIKNGLFRWDRINDLSKIKDKKLIFVFFTKRDYLKKISDVSKSVYVHEIIKILTNVKLQKALTDHNAEIKLGLHHTTANKVKNFLEIPNIQLISEDDIFKVKQESSLLLTDYSSMCFEFFIQNKPVVFYNIDDKEDCKLYGSKSDVVSPYKGKESELFNITYNTDELINLLIKYIKEDFKCSDEIKKIQNQYFYFKKDFCERFYCYLLECIEEKKQF